MRSISMCSFLLKSEINIAQLQNLSDASEGKMRLYICMYTHTHMHLHMYVYIYTYICTLLGLALLLFRERMKCQECNRRTNKNTREARQPQRSLVVTLTRQLSINGGLKRVEFLREDSSALCHSPPQAHM